MKKIVAIFLTIIIFIIISLTTFIVSAQTINSPVATYSTENESIQENNSIVIDNEAFSPQTGDNIIQIVIGSFIIILIYLIIFIITIWFIYNKGILK